MIKNRLAIYNILDELGKILFFRLGFIYIIAHFFTD